MKNIFVKFKNGFTLAEVLITLVIIGVIAALTIPTAINNTKEQELKSQFKKAYSTISQAINKTNMNDFYGYAQCYYGLDGGDNQVIECLDFYTALSKNLQVQKICQGNAKADGCIPTYQSYSTNSSNEGYSESKINNNSIVYVLSDSQIIILYMGGSRPLPLFLVDINGHKGPNAGGKDIFSFRLYKKPDNSPFLASDNCFPTVSGGKTTNDMIKYALAGVK